MNESPYYLTIEQFLQRFIGKPSASLLLVKFCASQHISPLELTSVHLHGLSQFIKNSLSVFVGEKRADIVLDQLRGLADQ